MPIVQSRTIPPTFAQRLFAEIRGLVLHPLGQRQRVRRLAGMGRDAADLDSEIQQPRRYPSDMGGDRIGGPGADSHGQADDVSHGGAPCQQNASTVISNRAGVSE